MRITISPTMTLSGLLALGEELAQAVEAERTARKAAHRQSLSDTERLDAIESLRGAVVRGTAALAAWRAAVASAPAQAPVADLAASADGLVTGDEVLAFTDGACSGNPGPGGWGILVQGWVGGQVGLEREHFGGEPDTTNNRMELMAAIQALEASDPRAPLTIVTDSAYLKDGISSWITGWKKRGWRNSAGEPVKNQDLWQRVDRLREGRAVKWSWVKAHTDGSDARSVENRRVDGLANRGMAPFKLRRA